MAGKPEDRGPLSLSLDFPPKIMTPPTARRFDSLTGLRGILAILVVIAHGAGRVGWYEHAPWVKRLFEAFGHFGVVGFFVLSGFILKSVYRNRKWTWQEFAINRFARIYPLYFACLIFALPIDWFSPGFPFEGKMEALGLSVVFQQSWFEFSNGRFNGPSWTLGVEFFFYALFPVLFLFQTRMRRIFTSFAIGLVAVTAALWNPEDFNLSHRVPHMRVWEFVFGILTADFHHERCQRSLLPRNPTLWALLAMAAGIACGAAHLPEGAHWAFVEQLAMGGAAMTMILLLASADAASKAFRPLALPFWLVAGEISYGIYLLHDAIQRYGKVAILKVASVPLESLSIHLKIAFICATGIISSIMAYILWKFLEVPARTRLRRLFADKTKGPNLSGTRV